MEGKNEIRNVAIDLILRQCISEYLICVIYCSGEVLIVSAIDKTENGLCFPRVEIYKRSSKHNYWGMLKGKTIEESRHLAKHQREVGVSIRG